MKLLEIVEARRYGGKISALKTFKLRLLSMSKYCSKAAKMPTSLFV